MSENKTPEQLSKEAQAKIDEQRVQVSNQVSSASTRANVASSLASLGVSPDTLEDVIKKILDQRKTEAVAKLAPKEPDYRTLKEEDILNPAIYIPVIEHDLPEYMHVELKDDEYVAVWVNRDQRQLGAKLAEGFELLKKEHLHPNYMVPLKFNSEGLYEYQDVVCMRVHKRIRFAKLRKYYEISKNQLRPAQAQENAKSTLMEKVILGDPALDAAFASGAYKFYNTET